MWAEEFPGAGAPVRRKPCLADMLPPGLVGRSLGWRLERRGDEGGREGVAKRAGSERKAEGRRARGRRFLNLVYANLKLTRVIYA